MPTAYLKKIAEEQGIALDKLEEYWSKAKDIAKKNHDTKGEDYWKYVMGIFKNMARQNDVSVSSAFESISKKVAAALTKKSPVKPAKPAKPVKAIKKAKTGKVVPRKKQTGRKTPVKKKAPAKPKAVKLPEWWVKLSEKSKATYVTKHPASRFVKGVAAKDPKLKKVLVQAQKAAGIDPHAPSGGVPEVDPPNKEELKNKVNEQIKKMHPGEQKPISPVTVKQPIAPSEQEPKVMPAGGPSTEEKHKEIEEEGKKLQVKHKSIFHRAYFKARQKISHTLKRNKLGLHCVGKFLSGYKLDEHESKLAKGWAGNAAKLLLGVAVGAAMFTPLAGMAPQLGEHFLALLMGTPASESSEDAPAITPLKLGDPHKFEPTDFTDRLHDWLMKQDIPALVEQLKKEGTPT